MKKIILFFAAAILLFGCGSTGNEKGTQGKDASAITINYETESGIPEFSATRNDAVELKYTFAKGDSSHMVMDYIMDIETMGMKIPMSMIMEIDYVIEDVVDNIASISITYTRVAMTMDGPQPMKFDSDNEEDMQSNEATNAFTMLLNNKIHFKIADNGKLQDMDLSQLLGMLPEGVSDVEKENIQKQIKGMSDQFSQNAFVALPAEPVKAGDVYEGGKVSTNTSGIQIDVDMKYKVISISEDHSYVVLEPMGTISMDSQMAEAGVKVDNSKLTGWMLLNLKKGVMNAGNMKMAMELIATQMGQEMKSMINMDMNIKTK